MADVNIYYHKQTDSWWTNSSRDGLELLEYIETNPIGLGTIECDTDDKNHLRKDNFYEILSMCIPSHLKMLNGITEDIKENGLKNATKIKSKRQLKKLLK